METTVEHGRRTRHGWMLPKLADRDVCVFLSIRATRCRELLAGDQFTYFRGFKSLRTFHAAMIAALMLSTGLATTSARAQAPERDTGQKAPHFVFSVELEQALKLAASHGRESLLASVYENVRVTPFRADAIRTGARGLAPGLSREISLATDLAVSHAASLRVAASRPPGADNDVDLDTIAEFDRNWGLGAIGAQEAVDRNLTGRGVVVGVIDSGIDRALDGTSHPEFAGRIDPRSTSLWHWFDPTLAQLHGSVAAGFTRPEQATEDANGHGTHVAGIIGAASDGNGMQGVAPGATILSIQALPSFADDAWVDENGYFIIDGTIYHAASLSYCGSDAYLVDINRCRPANPIGVGTSAAIAYMATQSDVRVINGSFGPDVAEGGETWVTGNLTAEAQAVRASLKAGQILTIAAGNERAKAPVYGENPSGIGLFPFINPHNAGRINSSGERIYTGSETADFSDMTDAALAAAEAADGIQRGRIIAVVATDSQKVIAEYSNYCGVAAEWCLAAPGGTYDDEVERPIYSTFPNGDYKAMQGTSMAAPHVAGAIAVLIEAYPTYTPAQITNILFETAEDLGDVGTDEVYGRGFLRLDLALQAGPTGLDPADTGAHVAGAGDAAGDKIVWAAPVNSSGSLDKQGQGTLVLLGNAAFSNGVAVGDGMLRVDGNLTADVDVDQDGTLSGNGTINGSVTSRGNLSPGASPGLLTVNGDLTLDPLGQTTIEVDGTAAQTGAGGFDRIAVTGTNRTVTVGGILAPVLRGITGAANNDFTPSLGQNFAFLNVADGRVAGSFSSLQQPATGLAAGTRFDVVYGERSVTLATTPLTYANLQPFGVAQSEAARVIGGVIDNLRPAAGVRPDASLEAFFTSLYLGSASGLGSGLEQATGRLYVDAGQTAVLSTGRFADLIWQHQVDLMLGGGPEGDDAHYWMEGGRWLAGHDGFDARSGGATFGVDIPLAAGWMGGAFRYEGSTISSGGRTGANLDTYHASVHALTSLPAVDLSGRAGMTYGRLDVNRSIDFGGGSPVTMTGEDHGLGGFAEASVQKTLAFGDISMMPSLTLGYRGFGLDGNRESGSGLPLSVSGQTFEEGHVTTALTLSHVIELDAGFRLTPSATLGYRRDLLAIASHGNAELFGSGFTMHGDDIGRDAFIGGIRVEANRGDGLSFSAGYELNMRRGVNQHRLSGSLALHW